MGFSTDAIHAGQQPEARTGAVITPLFQTSTYAQEGPAVHTGYEYGRTQNPTRQALEQNIAQLEGGSHGFSFASGMAAISTIAQLMKKGDHIIATENVYGGTYRYFTRVMSQFGITSSWVDTSKIENIEREITAATKIVFLETPTNPMLRLSDIQQISKLCTEKNILLVVDNTFLSPYFQRPLSLGADIVVHSTTKYLNGHSDVIGGIVVTSNNDIAEKLAFLQNSVGAVPAPFDCWLILRSTKTLAVRMKAHDENAMQIATFLQKHPQVENVIYPNLKTFSQFELVQRQHKSPNGKSAGGGMISFTVANPQKADRVLRKFELFTLAESLGGVESLVNHPASMTHASVPQKMRQKIGLTDSLIRLSVGIEDIEDLLADLTQALEA